MCPMENVYIGVINKKSHANAPQAAPNNTGPRPILKGSNDTAKRIIYEIVLYSISRARGMHASETLRIIIAAKRYCKKPDWILGIR